MVHIGRYRHNRHPLPYKNKKINWCSQTRATRLEVSQGHRTVIAFHMLGVVSYCAIVTLSLRRAVFTIFDFKKCRDLEIWVRGHSVGPFETLCMVSCYIVFFSNIVPKRHRFWDIRLQKCRDLENRVRGPSRSLEMSPFDRVHMTSYWHFIVTTAPSRVVSSIFNV